MKKDDPCARLLMADYINKKDALNKQKSGTFLLLATQSKAVKACTRLKFQNVYRDLNSIFIVLNLGRYTFFNAAKKTKRDWDYLDKNLQLNDSFT